MVVVDEMDIELGRDPLRPMPPPITPPIEDEVADLEFCMELLKLLLPPPPLPSLSHRQPRRWQQL